MSTCSRCGGCACHDAVPWVMRGEENCPTCHANASTKHRCPVLAGHVIQAQGHDARHCHADGAGPCRADDCPIAGLGPLVNDHGAWLRPCPGAPGPQHPARVFPPAGGGA